ncbi:MAG: PD40 domain-containing protein, partial [Ignavibacteriales bacterium]|nr:PD40 domain-containing protein [Ignavibacteriales bacterium]
HLRNIRQLTFGGTNAEAYFSFDEKKLIFQSTRSSYRCDQIFTMNLDGSGQKLVSMGKGRTTCAYFFPGSKKILFASTHAANDLCPPSPDKSKGYVWGVFNSYDIYTANADGTNLKILTASKGYDAEATIAPNGKKIVFTSSRNGDLDLFTMNLDGTGIKQITNDIGYDGGANFSWDGKRVVYRAYHPKEDSAVTEYKSLLAEELVKPSKMEIFICNADGRNKKQLTNSGTANFAPFFHPDNKRIIFSSNMKDPRGRNFELFLIKDDGTSLEQATFGGHFNSFPMFTRDGKKIVFVSDRNAKDRYEFNVFIADWVE